MPTLASSSPRVLISDGDSHARAESAAYLREHGIDVVETDELSPDDVPEDISLIVADVSEGADGMEGWLSVVPAAHRPPVVFISSEPTITGAVRAMKAGADDYLAKPLFLPTLLERVLSALEPRDDLHEVTRGAIRWALDRSSGNVTRAAALLGVPRSTMYQRIAMYGLKSKRIVRHSPA